jgi:hypothetical protein
MSPHVPAHSWALLKFDFGQRQRRGSPMFYVQRLQNIHFIFSLDQRIIVFPANLESRFLLRLSSKTPKPSHPHAIKTMLLLYLSIYSPNLTPGPRWPRTGFALSPYTFSIFPAWHYRPDMSPLSTSTIAKFSPSILPMLRLSLHCVLLPPPRRRSSA